MSAEEDQKMPARKSLPRAEESKEEEEAHADPPPSWTTSPRENSDDRGLTSATAQQSKVANRTGGKPGDAAEGIKPPAVTFALFDDVSDFFFGQGTVGEDEGEDEAQVRPGAYRMAGINGVDGDDNETTVTPWANNNNDSETLPPQPEVTARPVQETPSASVAVPFGMSRMGCAFLIGGAIFIVTGLVLGLVFGLRSDDDELLVVTLSPTPAPIQGPLLGNWSQLGREQVGEGIGDRFGQSIAMSADGNIVAVGAPLNGGVDNFNSDRGSVHVYFWNGTLWTQLGSILNGENEDRFGWSVALSADGKVLAVGAPYNNDNGFESGHVRVFQLANDGWSRVGSNLNGENAGDQFGRSVALSADGTVLAVGAPQNDDSGFLAGQARIFQLVNNDWWSQVGSSLNGENDGDRFGSSVALSADGTVLAVGAPYAIASSGCVRIFQIVNDDWAQLGSAINGKGEGDGFGGSVALSADGKTVAGGAGYNNGGPGYVLVLHRLEEEDA